MEQVLAYQLVQSVTFLCCHQTDRAHIILLLGLRIRYDLQLLDVVFREASLAFFICFRTSLEQVVDLGHVA